MTDETENLDSLNEETETNDSPNVETVEETTETTEETQVDDVEALKEQNRQLFARAKKAEGFVLQDGKWLKPKAEVKAEPPKEGLSGEEALVLMGAGVTHIEDISEVQNYAKFKGISISEALKDSVVKTLLSDKAEKRKTAEATVPASRGNKKTSSSDDLLQRVKKTNVLPESEEEAKALAEAKMQEWKNKKK